MAQLGMISTRLSKLESRPLGAPAPTTNQYQPQPEGSRATQEHAQTQSWAQVTRNGRPNQALPLRQPPQQKALEASLYLTIRVSDPKERQGLGLVPRDQILKRLLHSPRPGVKKIIGVLRHPSGDIRLTLASQDAKTELEANQDWLGSLGASAHLAQRRWAVLAHGVGAQGLQNPQEHLPALQQGNTLHPGLKIQKAHWLKAPTGAHGSLILEVNTPEDANALINKGFNHDLLVHPCEVYHQHLRIQQCYNCQGFGHQSRACKALTKCGRCALGHQSKDCPKKDTRGTPVKFILGGMN